MYSKIYKRTTFSTHPVRQDFLGWFFYITLHIWGDNFQTFIDTWMFGGGALEI